MLGLSLVQLGPAYFDKQIVILIIFHFSDDPDMAVTAPGVTEEHIEKGFEETPPDPEQFCSCGLCSSMATQAESFCCKSVNYLQAGGE